MKKTTLVVILVLIIVPISIWFVNTKADSNMINNSSTKVKDSETYASEEIITDEQNKETAQEDETKSNDTIENDETEDSIIDEKKLIKYDSQNGIDMSVMLKNPSYDKDNMAFEILVNNHFIDLEEIPYDELARLINSQEKIIDKGFIWESNGGGHHISGSLKLPKNDFNELINENIDYLVLEFTEVGNADKLSFRWDKEILDFYFKGGIE